jgi:anti-anti-sigma factor
MDIARGSGLPRRAADADEERYALARYVTTIAAPDQRMRILKIDGELDIATIDACRAELDAALADCRQCRGAPPTSHRRPPSAVVLDLSGLTFLSVAGIRMLSAVVHPLSAQHIRTVVAVPRDGIVRRLVHLAGLDRQVVVVDHPYPTPSSIIRSAPTVNEAVRRPRQGGSHRSTARTTHSAGRPWEA